MAASQHTDLGELILLTHSQFCKMTKATDHLSLRTCFICLIVCGLTRTNQIIHTDQTKINPTKPDQTKLKQTKANSTKSKQTLAYQNNFDHSELN